MTTFSEKPAVEYSSDALFSYPPSSGAFVVDHGSGDICWTAGLKALFGWRVADSLGWEDLWPRLYPEDRGAVVSAIAHSLEFDGPRYFRIEHRILRVDGEMRWLRVDARTLFDAEDGDSPRPLQTIGTVRDITLQKLAASNRPSRATAFELQSRRLLR